MTRSIALGNRDLPREDRAARYAGVTVAGAFHALLIVALLHYEPAQRALETVAPIMVNLITPPRLEATPVPPQQPKPILKPRPRPARKPVEPPPVIAAPADADAPSAFVAPPLQRAPPVETAAQDEPAPPAPVVPPRFNADYLQNPAPPYPPLARRMGEKGKVVLRVLVSVEGIAERVELKSSSGSSRLDQSALTTVKGWKFVPARQGDQKLAAWVLVPIVFTIEG